MPYSLPATLSYPHRRRRRPIVGPHSPQVCLCSCFLPRPRSLLAATCSLRNHLLKCTSVLLTVCLRRLKDTESAQEGYLALALSLTNLGAFPRRHQGLISSATSLFASLRPGQALLPRVRPDLRRESSFAFVFLQTSFSLVFPFLDVVASGLPS